MYSLFKSLTAHSITSKRKQCRLGIHYIKNFVPHCPEALRYAKVWGRDVVRSFTLAYAKRLFLDSNP